MTPPTPKNHCYLAKIASVVLQKNGFWLLYERDLCRVSSIEYEDRVSSISILDVKTQTRYSEKIALNEVRFFSSIEYRVSTLSIEFLLDARHLYSILNTRR